MNMDVGSIIVSQPDLSPLDYDAVFDSARTSSDDGRFVIRPICVSLAVVPRAICFAGRSPSRLCSGARTITSAMAHHPTCRAMGRGCFATGPVAGGTRNHSPALIVLSSNWNASYAAYMVNEAALGLHAGYVSNQTGIATDANSSAGLVYCSLSASTTIQCIEGVRNPAQKGTSWRTTLRHLEQSRARP